MKNIMIWCIIMVQHGATYMVQHGATYMVQHGASYGATW
jgi:hypothetical protein